MFDTISAHKLEDTTTFNLYLPDGRTPATVPAGEDSEGNPKRQQMTMTVRRLSSGPMQRFVNRGKNKSITGLQKQQRAKRKLEVSAESIEEQAVDLLVFSIVAWEGFTSNGEPVPCTEENVRALIADEKFIWIRDQVDTHVGDDTLYDLGNSSTS